ncbi:MULTISPECIES: hypothetical protein [Streptomyces]|uniref:Integral membrane protein n=1 Tax=Streptomyces lycii TaxID=2654337 RepID=A0ABQ7F9M6_9ACTN|nr:MULTISPECIES: hypothetical protein [Streptomyces]KAF4405417.1 hypothetical protein GCU69_30655 [Streptomyces lycii]PGH49981.1 hypothetical protein CRI70_14600 [Streptomyces sp. Ru87]
MARTKSKRPLPRRAGESAFGLLLVSKYALMAAVALLLLVAGVWTSWDSAQHAMLTKGRERGTVTIETCSQDTCTGPFTPADPAGEVRPEVTIDKAVTSEKGERLAVAVKPGTEEVVRTGTAGVLHSWVPFAGSLLLAALVVAGGLRMRRTAWATGALGAVLLAGAFLTL